MGEAGAATRSDDAVTSDARDRYLDAFARVVRRHGLSHARVQSVADELGVSRVTVYRQVGTVPEMTALLFQRELARVLPDPGRWVGEADAVGALIRTLADIARVLRGHPVLDKVITDEPHLLGTYLVRDLPQVLAQSAAMGASLFNDAMRKGKIATRDTGHLADWVARVLFTAVMAPPSGSLEAFFDAGLRPLLEPGPVTRRKRS